MRDKQSASTGVNQLHSPLNVLPITFTAEHVADIELLCTKQTQRHGIFQSRFDVSLVFIGGMEMRLWWFIG